MVENGDESDGKGAGNEEKKHKVWDGKSGSVGAKAGGIGGVVEGIKPAVAKDAK